MATVANFNIDQGSSFSTTINVESSTSGVFQLNNYSARGKIRKSYKSGSYVSFNCSISFKLGPSIPGITILISEFKSKGKSFGESPKPIILIF